MTTDVLHLTAGNTDTIAEDWQAVAKLNAKLCALTDAVPVMEKESKQRDQGWTYTSYDAVAATVTPLLAHIGLSLSVSVEQASTAEVTLNSGKMAMETELFLALTFTDIETGAMRVVRGYSLGRDSQDKSGSKAITTALKYSLMRNLLMSDEDDPDGHDDVEDQLWGYNVKRARAALCGWTKAHAEQLNVPAPSYDEIKRTLRVAHLVAYTGTKADAKASIHAMLQSLKQSQSPSIPPSESNSDAVPPLSESELNHGVVPPAAEEENSTKPRQRSSPRNGRPARTALRA